MKTIATMIAVMGLVVVLSWLAQAQTGDETELPPEHTLSIDADTNEASLSGSLSHFSSIKQDLVRHVSVMVAGLPDRWLGVGERFDVSVTLETTTEVKLRADRVAYFDKTFRAVNTMDAEALDTSEGKSLGAVNREPAIKRTTVIEYRCQEAGLATFKAKIVGQLLVFDRMEGERLDELEKRSIADF